MMSKLTFESKEGHRQAEMSVMTFQAESTTNIEALRWIPVGDGDDQTKARVAGGSLGEGAEEGVRVKSSRA